MKLLGITLFFAGILVVTPAAAQTAFGNTAPVQKTQKNAATGKSDNGLFKKKKRKKDCDCPGSKKGQRKIARQRRQHTTK